METSIRRLPPDPDNPGFARRDVLRGAAATSIATFGTVLLAGSSQANIWEEGEVQCHATPAEKTPDYALDDALLADFMSVSRTLTGLPLATPEDVRLGREYLERFARLNVPTIDLRKLTAAHAAPADAIMGNSEIRPAAEQLIYLWYLSVFFLPTPDAPGGAWIYGTTAQYERALLWTVIGAHAPMMPMHGGGKDYWAREGRLPYPKAY